MANAIDPSRIPGSGIDPDSIDAQAQVVASIAGRVRDHGAAVHRKWQAMAGVYTAPESGMLLELMHPVNSEATVAGDNLDGVASALRQFAEDVRPIKAELDSLRERASAFGESIENGVQVRELDPDWSLRNSLADHGMNPAGAGDTPKWRFVQKEWHEVQEQVDRNNELIAAVNAQQVLLWEAERACANKIRGLYGASGLRPAESDDDILAHGLSEIPAGTEMPWGADVERTEGCAEATVNVVVKDFLWEGIIVGGVWGTVTGVATLTLGYNPETGALFDPNAYGASWGNLGNLAAAGVMNTGPVALIFAADNMSQSTGGGGFLPQELRDFKAQADEAAVNTGKALIAWDKWEDDPGTAAGETVFNVGTLLIPVGGAAVAGVKTASVAASVVSKTAKVANAIDPATWAVAGAVRVGGVGLRGLDSLIARIDTKRLDPGVNPGDLAVFVADDAASAMQALEKGGVDLSQVTARIDESVPVLEFPGGRVELPEGAFDVIGGGRGQSGTDAEVTAPARELQLVTADGVRGETSAGPVNSLTIDPPPHTDTGSAIESTAVREPATTTEHPHSSSGSGSAADTGSGGGGRSDDGEASSGTRDPELGAGTFSSGARDQAPGDGRLPTSFHPGSYEPGPVRDTVPARDAPARYSVQDVQRTLDNAPQNEFGQPVDHRNGRPLLLENSAGDRGWIMRWDPEAEAWIAENRGLNEYGMPLRGEPGSYGYDKNGNLLPYANHRPAYADGQVEEVWTASRDAQIKDINSGDLPLPVPPDNKMWVQVRDIAEGPGIVDTLEGKWRLIEWEPGQPRNRLWDMGHIETAPYVELRDRYLSHRISQKVFLSQYHAVQNYRVEDWLRNRSHDGE